jgi:hypothetical protein
MPGFVLAQPRSDCLDAAAYAPGAQQQPSGLERVLADVQPFALPGAVVLLAIAIVFAARQGRSGQVVPVLTRLGVGALAAAVLVSRMPVDGPWYESWLLLPVGLAAFASAWWIERLVSGAALRRAQP